MQRGRDHGTEAMRIEREHCRSGHASEVDRQMPHVERRKFHRNILVQDPVRAHQAKRDCGHCALGTATPPGGKSKRSQQEGRSEEHTSELQSLMRISYAVFCLKKKKEKHRTTKTQHKYNIT